MTYIILLSLLPSLLVCIYIYFRDLHEKEPIKLLLKAFFFGMLSTVFTLFIHIALGLVGFEYNTNPFMSAFVGAATIEECNKFILLLCLIWKNSEFNERFDGIVYAVFVSMGFAFVENALYVFDDTSNYISTFVARLFFATPAHFLFAVSMGYFVSVAKFNPTKRKRNLVYALLSAILLHGVYDYLLMYANATSSTLVSFILMVLFYIFDIFMWRLGIKKIRKASEADKPNSWQL
ncbi:MAG: PrsW family intramembrane metalloprotease [Bacteroidia bacterium]|nr:PrsW family intramembrane metalloprotease [Bacteroidia bacterium]